MATNMNAVTSDRSERYRIMYHDSVTRELQQRESILQQITSPYPYKGKSAQFPSIAKQSTLRQRTTLNLPAVADSVSHSVRWGYAQEYYKMLRFSTLEELMLMTDPTSLEQQEVVALFNRQKDQTIIDAITATVVTGEAADGSTAWQTDATSHSLADGGQLLPVDATVLGDDGGASSGLTQLKLHVLDEYFEGLSYTDMITLVIGPRQKTQLRQIPAYVSYDYNDQKPLVGRAIGEWQGFRFVVSNLLPKLSSGAIEQCFAIADGALGSWAPEPLYTATEEPVREHGDKFLYSRMCVGAVRLAEERIVEVRCSNAS